MGKAIPLQRPGIPHRATVAVLAATIALGSFASLFAQAVYEIDLEAKRQTRLKRAALINAAGEAERVPAAGGDRFDITSANQTLMKAQRAYFEVRINDALERVSAMDRRNPETARTLCRQYLDAWDRFVNNRGPRIKNAYRLVKDAETDAARAERLGEAKGQMRADFVEITAASEVLSAWYPTAQCRATIVQHRTRRIDVDQHSGVAAVVHQLSRLAGLIGSIDPDYPPAMRDVDMDFSMKMYGAERDLALEEFRRLAVSGVLIDPRNNRPIHGGQRVEIARLIMLNIADYLEHVSKRPLAYDPLSFHNNRAELAEAIRKDIESNPADRAAAYMEGGIEPEPQMFFRATSLALRAEKDLVTSRFNKEYLGDSYWNMGAGQVFRANNLWTHQNKLSSVRKRLKKGLKDLEVVAKAFDAAAETDVDELRVQHPDTFKLLKAFGYILEFEGDGGEKRYRYSVPESREGLAIQVKRTKEAMQLPGAAVLDVITPKNTAVAVLSIFVPEAAGARLAALARGAGLSREGILASELFGELAANAGINVAAEAIDHKGEVDYQKVIFESVVLGSILKASGSVTRTTLHNVMQEVAKAQRGTRLYKAVEEFIRANPRKSYIFYHAILEGFDMSTETGITAAFQSQVEHEKVDSTALITLMLNSAFNRALARHKSLGLKTIREFFQGELPRQSPELAEFFRRRPQVRAEVEENQVQLAHRLEQQKQRIAERVDPEPLKAYSLFTMLLKGDVNWSEVKQIHAKDPRFLGDAMVELAGIREAFIKRIIHDARVASVDEINAHFDWRENRIKQGSLSAAEKTEKLDALRRRRREELDLVNAELFGEGSNDPSSDIDRSSASVYLRKNLRILYELYAKEFLYIQTGEDSLDVMNSADSLDVNEYINVFPMITENAEHVASLKKQVMRTNDQWNPPGSGQPEWPGKVLMTQSEALQALSLSGFIETLQPRQLDQFVANKREEIKKGIEEGRMKQADLDLFEKQLAFSLKSIETTEKRLETYREGIARKDGLPADHPNVIIEARDHLYDIRLREIRELEWEMSELQQEEGPDSERVQALRAYIERKMCLAMRDGIETYTNTVGLDIVVNRVQAARNEDGSKKTAAQRLEEPGFTLKRELNMYEKRDVDSAIYDQARFIIEHINAYNAGREESYLTGRALGKYLERTFLLMKIGGLDINAVRKRPDYDSTKRLLKIAQDLAELKPYPEKINQYLTTISEIAPQSPSGGLAEIFNLIEHVIPGMYGLTGVAPARLDAPKVEFTHAPHAHFKPSEPIDPDVRRLRDVTFVAGGKGASEFLQKEIDVTNAEIQRIKAEMDSTRQLARQYRLPRIDDVRRSLRKVDNLNQILLSMPWPAKNSATYQSQVRALLEQKDHLYQARQDKLDDPDQTLLGDPQTPGYQRLEKRLKWLQNRLTWLGESLESADRLAKQQARFDGLDLSGDWTCKTKEPETWIGTITQQGDDVHMEFHQSESGDRSVRATFDGTHRWGIVRGRWTDSSTRTEPMIHAQKQTMTTMVFRAEVAPSLDTLTFTHAPGHPRTSYRWDGTICRRGISEQPARAEDFIRIVVGDPPADLAHLTRQGQELKYGMFEITSQTEAGPEPFVADPDRPGRDTYTITLHKRRVGRKRFPGLMLPGTYEITIRTGGRTEHRPLQISAGKKTTVIVQMGYLKVVDSSATGRPFDGRVRIFTPGDETTPIDEWDPANPLGRYPRFDPSKGFRLPPGTYSVALGTKGGLSSWIRKVTVKPRATTPVTAALSVVTLSVDADFQFKGVQIRPATESDENSVEWIALDPSSMEFSGRNVTLRIPPGTYEVRLPTTRGPVEHTFTAVAGKPTIEKISVPPPG